MHLVASFPRSYGKLDVDNICDKNNILSDFRSAAKLNFLAL
jgi:hypothetical protein